MKSLLTTIALAVLATGSSAFAADADCEEAFRIFLRGDKSDYPVTARAVTEMAGRKMVSISAAQDANTSMTIDESSGMWVVLRDGTGWSSMDKGKSWNKTYTLDPAQTAKQKENLVKRAEQATNIACTDDVAFEGGTYRLLSGEWKAADGSGLSGRSDYYLDENGRWQVTVYDMNMNGQRTKITQVRVPEGEELTVPEVE